MSSTRLPGKVMKDLGGHPVLRHVVEGCRKASRANLVMVATSVEKEDTVISDFCTQNAIPCYRGSLNNVLERYYEAAQSVNAEVIVRITADCPLIEGTFIDRCIDAFEKSGADYASNIHPTRTVPKGLDVEVFNFRALERAYKEATDAYDKEHVTPYIWRNTAEAFKIAPSVWPDKPYNETQILALDSPADYARLKVFFATKPLPFSLRPARKEDSQFLFDLRNEEAVRCVSSNPDPISLETHHHWFEKKLASKESVIFIAEEEGTSFAQTRFDIVDEETADISIAVIATKRGKGYGALLIGEATKCFLSLHPKVSLVRAFIKPENAASLRSFLKAGYLADRETTQNGVRFVLLIRRR